MKLAAVAAICLGALSEARPAEACTRAPTCGETYCLGPAAVIAAGIVNRQPDGLRVTLQITSVHGDAAELTAGSTVTLDSDAYTLYESDVGTQLYLYLERDSSQRLRVQYRIDPLMVAIDGCFAPDAGVATVAAVALSPGCYETLVPEPPPPSGCPDQVGLGCSAGGSAAPSLASLALLGMVMRARRRADRTSRTRR